MWKIGSYLAGAALLAVVAIGFYPKETKKVIESAAKGVEDTLRQKFMPYEDFKPGDERKFLPFSCRKYHSATKAGDFNGDGRKDFATLCDLSDHNRTTSQYYNNLFVVLSGKDGYHGMRFDITSDIDFKVVRIGEKDEFLSYSRSGGDILVYDESTMKRTAHVLRCSDDSCNIEDENLSAYLDGLCQAGEMDAIKQFWKGQYFEKQHAADSIKRMKPPESVAFLLQESTHDNQAMRVMSELSAFLTTKDILSIYRKGSDDALRAMERLAKSSSDKIIITDLCVKIIADDNYYHAKPSFFNAGEEKLREYNSCSHKRAAVDVLSHVQHPYADAQKSALVGSAYNNTIPECVAGHIKKTFKTQ